MEFNHVPVMLNECIEGLNIKKDGIYIDGTIGGGNHSSYIAKNLSKRGRLIGFDQDEDAIAVAKAKLGEYNVNIDILHYNFCFMKDVLNNMGISKVDGILLDLGVSSYQIDEASRGFSYMKDGDLDMRMDKSQDLTAYDIVNSYEEEELYRILKLYGEEKCARKLAQAICKKREEQAIRTTLQLVDIVRSIIPDSRINGHPAKRTFQALRIEVNSELKVLERALDDAVDLLNNSGRLCVITFHSLEDRIVKNKFKNFVNPCTCPPSFPVCVCNKKPKGRIITKKPIIASDEEMGSNSRSRSAKLRIFEHF